MTTSDMAIPEIKLVQNVGGDEAKQLGAKSGDFYCGITQEIIPGDKGFEVVVIGPAVKTRTYWGRTEIGDEPPVCASQDGINSINGEVCATACPYQAFTDAPYMVDAGERRNKCLPNFNVFAIKLSDMMPIMIRCSGISAMAARELNTLLRFHKAIRGQSFKAKLRVSAIKKKTASGEAFAIKFGEPQLITDTNLLAELKEQAVALGQPSALVEIPAETETKPQLKTPAPVEPPKQETKPAEPKVEKSTAKLEF